MKGTALLAAAVVLCGCGGSREHSTTKGRFRDAATETGLDFRHFNGATGQFYLPEIMGAGVALLDYDNDGDLDVLVLQGTALGPGHLLFPPAAGSKPGHRLFRNELIPSGRLRFTDVTEHAGIGIETYGMGVATGDYDNDGYPDLYLTGYGRNILYHNNGNGTFSDVTRTAGVEDSLWSTSAAFFDYDRDGLLDRVVLHYVDFTVANNKICQAATGEPDYCTPKAYRGLPARLFHNVGHGKFEDVTERSGISSAYGPGLGVIADDFSGDGWPDLYVANDTAANLLWINQKNGTFKEAALESGAAYASDGVARAGMGVTADDFDCDGADDLLITNLMGEGVTLFHNNGRGDFEDVTLRYGLARHTTAFTGFGTQWFDFDNDGKLDLFVANGAVTIMENQRGKPYPFEQTNQLLRNEGSTFRDISTEAGLALHGIGRGAAFGDVNNDGRVDVVVADNNGPVRLLLNETAAAGHWLEVKLDGGKPNRMAIGARVAVLRQGRPPLWRHVHTDGSYLSASDARVHFGLGDDAKVESIEVLWPDGSRERFGGVPADRVVSLGKMQKRPLR